MTARFATAARRQDIAALVGDVLDLVVDVMNYVFVPAFALTAGGLLPPAVATALGVVIVVTGSLYFADRRMKTADYYFRGFPVSGTWRHFICSYSSCRLGSPRYRSLRWRR